jgi:hypothetical protein
MITMHCIISKINYKRNKMKSEINSGNSNKFHKMYSEIKLL